MSEGLEALVAPYQLGRLRLANRIVLGPHGTGFVDAETHLPTPRQADYLAERAKGGVGVVMQGSIMVHDTGVTASQLNATMAPGATGAFRRLADSVHEHGVPIIGQLSHLGRQGNTYASHRELWAPSPVPDPVSRVVPHQMTAQEIKALTGAFRSAARTLLDAGFDGFEIYMAHGYLLGSFLSPASNKRSDAYGGSVERRARFPLEVLAAVREEAGPDVPIGARISSDEFISGGISVEEAEQTAALLAHQGGADFLNVSQSNYQSRSAMVPDMSFPAAPFAQLAGRIKKAVGAVPVMAAGRITPEAAAELIGAGTIDLAVMVRPLIADPELARKISEGAADRVRPCIYCNVGCRGGHHRGLPLACLVNPAVGYERTRGAGRLPKPDRPLRVLVAGAGPAGLKAAETAALLGHTVTVAEKGGQPGGHVAVAASAMPYRGEFGKSVAHLVAELGRLNVPILLNTEVTADYVAEQDPDVVVVAAGARTGRPDIPGIDGEGVITEVEAITLGVPGTGPVAVLDSGEADWRSLTTAENLAHAGHEVHLVSPVSAGQEIDGFSLPPLLQRLSELGVRLHSHHAPVAVSRTGVRIRDLYSGQLTDLEATWVVLAWYGVANDELFHQVAAQGRRVHAVGDCLAPRRAIDAIWDGFRVGAEI